MAGIITRPEGVAEWTVPVNLLDGLSMQEKLDFFRINAASYVSLFKRFPDYLEYFKETYGQQFADDLIAFVEGTT